jgi:hypothetical protein
MILDPFLYIDVNLGVNATPLLDHLDIGTPISDPKPHTFHSRRTMERTMQPDTQNVQTKTTRSRGCNAQTLRPAVVKPSDVAVGVLSTDL